MFTIFLLLSGARGLTSEIPLSTFFRNDCKVAVSSANITTSPLAARAQQPAMPAIGYLDSRSPDVVASRLRAFRQGLRETGYVENENVAILYRFAEDRIDRLPELAGDLACRQVAVIAAPAGAPAALAAKAATTTIPIVFVLAEDPARLGLVASLARPGGNLTGINFLSTELAAKRLELLRELVPGAARAAVLVNPGNATTAESTLRGMEPAARAMGLQIHVLNAGIFDACARPTLTRSSSTPTPS